MDFRKTYGSANPKDDAQWFDFDDAKLLIAPMDNPAMRRATISKFSLSDLAGGDDGLARGNAFETMKMEAELVASHVLLDWQNVQEGGKDLPYSPEVGTEYLVDIQDLREFVNSKATELAKSRREALENAKKKSKK